VEVSSENHGTIIQILMEDNIHELLIECPTKIDLFIKHDMGTKRAMIF
jgi:hypothetical protein